MNINEKLNPLSADPTKWSNTLKLFVGNLQFEHFYISKNDFDNIKKLESVLIFLYFL